MIYTTIRNGDVVKAKKRDIDRFIHIGWHAWLPMFFDTMTSKYIVMGSAWAAIGSDEKECRWHSDYLIKEA